MKPHSPPTPSFKMAVPSASLMGIPSEIRLSIIQHLLNDKGNTVFEIRNEDPDVFLRRPSTPRRSKYRVLGRDLIRQSRETTYRLVIDTDMHPQVMAVNRKLHEEASHELYTKHAFSFDRDIEAIVPFFDDLGTRTRPLVCEISLVKQGFVYSRDFDRCEWTSMCEALKSRMQIKKINLTVEGGKPSVGWTGLPQYTMDDYRTLASVRFDALEWVWKFLSITGIQELNVSDEIHHCPPSHSTAMEFFAAFSASINTGFTDFLRSELRIQ